MWKCTGTEFTCLGANLQAMLSSKLVSNGEDICPACVRVDLRLCGILTCMFQTVNVLKFTALFLCTSTFTSLERNVMRSKLRDQRFQCLSVNDSILYGNEQQRLYLKSD